ncbi:hypothetical protein LCGC14_2126350 [marine sediment metagenome]|uniref:Uncharacterized protein n=1 Tax=marine sediment metagenome TaxID=412755 RepID=A0A0F9E2T3_9ZZZZ|nr:hypothetical protein [Phycisphaerales bacterium]
MPNEPLINFNSGELSPLIDARSDIEKYKAGCRVLENMIPRVYGIAERRPGLQFIRAAIDNDTIGRVIPFIYSNSIAYIIEMGDQVFRFYFDGGIVLDSNSNIVTTATPYLAADLFEVQFVQSLDVMYLTHQSYAPRTLSRTSASEFTLEEIDFRFGPFLTRNDYIEDNDVTLSCSAINATEVGTLTAIGPFSPLSTFQSGHVGSLWKLTLPRVITGTDGTATVTGTIGDAIGIDGPFTFKTSGHWGATVELQRNEDDNGWETFRTWTSVLTAGVGSLNAQYTGIEYAQNTSYRINVTTYSGGTVQASLTVNSSTQSGIVRVQAVTSASVATVKVISRLASTNTTKQWNEGAWSRVRGYPKTLCISQGRAIYAGTAFQSQTLWFSQTGAYSIIT